jgi:hypothetical protein
MSGAYLGRTVVPCTIQVRSMAENVNNPSPCLTELMLPAVQGEESQHVDLMEHEYSFGMLIEKQTYTNHWISPRSCDVKICL